MNSITLGRMFSSVIPEEILLDRAIEALIAYKKEKFEEVETPNSFESLKELFTSSKVDPTKIEEAQNNVKTPEVELMTLVLKWADAEKDIFQILKEGEEIEQHIRTFRKDD